MLSCTALCRYAKATPKQESILEGTEDPVPSASTSSIALTEEEQEELRKELAKVEDEVRTLSQVLSLKEKRLGEIKKKLGITPFGELKQSLTRSWQQVTTSTAYKRTSETLTQVGQRATAALSTAGATMSRRLEEVRNSPTFKSFGEGVENLKTKMSPQTSPQTASRDVAEGLSPAESASPTEVRHQDASEESEELH
ncbi:tumor protein D52-like isoform X1 [Megalops cyprinoides]|uniref:tumor protein D52-like isoform X1 n=1 Tax=Megalops cyprinoides TaxID=118141 RepID=UPI00186455CE|nr:tumor protein D52-like isoform X1 [Megalops cyprinoides]